MDKSKNVCCHRHICLAMCSSAEDRERVRNPSLLPNSLLTGKSYKSKSARSAHFVGVYYVANYCRRCPPPSIFGSPFRSDKSWQRQEQSTAATFFSGPVRRITTSSSEALQAA